MLAINYPRAYTNTGGHGAYRLDQSRRPDRDAKISIIANAQGALWSLDGATEFPLMFAPLVEGASLPKVDAQIIDTLESMVADGYNGLMIRSPTSRYWTESGSNWGVWEYIESDASYVNRWAMEEDALIQMDKMIAWALDLGIECVWIDLEGYDDIINRHANQRPQGTYQGRGMGWSTEYDQMAWDVNSRIFTRTSRITGVRHCDNGRIIWKFDNENGFSDSYTRTTTSNWGGSAQSGANTSGTAIVTGLSDTSLLRTGWGVSGTGVPTSTTILSIDSATQITLSANTTTSGTRTFTFSCRWFDKIIRSATDSYGANGYWRTELATKWVAWVTASSYSASVGVNGSAGAWNGCVPDQAAFTALTLDSNDRNAVLDFVSQMDVEHIERTIAYVDAAAPRGDVVLCTGTWTYHCPRAHVGLSAASMARGNLFCDTHHYLPDGVSSGVKSGSVTTRQSIFDSGWVVVTNGLALTDVYLGQRSTTTGFVASEEGQYGPNGWRYERAALSAIMACRHRHPIALFNWAQQVTTDQLLTDGKGMTSDHVNVSSQCDRLMARCISPIVLHRFFSPASGTFTVLATKASIQAKSHAQGTTGFFTNRLNAAAISDGSEHGVWADKAVVLSIDESNTPTTVWTDFPKVADATLASGTYLVNTATEKIHLRHDHGIQAMSPYVNWFIGEMLASPVFAMPLSISNLAAAITRAHLCIRSDGPWPLFEGPWMMFIHGSDYSLDLVTQGGGAIGEAAWLADSDLQVLNYATGSTWSNTGTTTDQRLMMPETLTIALDASGASGVFASLEQEVFKIGNDGLPVRVVTSFSSGVTSFAYDATCPVFYGHPVAKRNTSARGRR